VCVCVCVCVFAQRLQVFTRAARACTSVRVKTIFELVKNVSVVRAGACDFECMHGAGVCTSTSTHACTCFAALLDYCAREKLCACVMCADTYDATV
jgi:hypothetical protein